MNYKDCILICLFLLLMLYNKLGWEILINIGMVNNIEFICILIFFFFVLINYVFILIIYNIFVLNNNSNFLVIFCLINIISI